MIFSHLWNVFHYSLYTSTLQQNTVYHLLVFFRLGKSVGSFIFSKSVQKVRCLHFGWLRLRIIRTTFAVLVQKCGGQRLTFLTKGVQNSQPSWPKRTWPTLKKRLNFFASFSSSVNPGYVMTFLFWKTLSKEKTWLAKFTLNLIVKT